MDALEFTAFQDDEPKASPSGYGAFFFPEVVSVKEDDDSSPRDLKDLGLNSRRTREIVLEHTLPNRKTVIVSDDEFVGVFMNKRESISFLNTIFATALAWSIQGDFL